jgi:hypothetical protein
MLSEVPPQTLEAIITAIGQERKLQSLDDDSANLHVLRKTLLYSQYVAKWAKNERNFAASLEDFYLPSSSEFSETPPLFH